MAEIVLEGDGRAVIHNRETGQVMTCSVPTALENVANSRGVWAHGNGDGKVRAPAKPAPEPVPEPVIALVDPDHLPLPEADPVSQAAIDDQLRPIADDHVHAEPVEIHPLDHDGDGRKGGSKPKAGAKAADPERAALFAALAAKGIKAFKGAPTDKLKALLAG